MMSEQIKFQVCSTSKMLFVVIDACRRARIITVLSLDISKNDESRDACTSGFNLTRWIKLTYSIFLDQVDK
jgi:hypothetical protein